MIRPVEKLTYDEPERKILLFKLYTSIIQNIKIEPLHDWCLQESPISDEEINIFISAADVYKDMIVLMHSSDKIGMLKSDQEYFSRLKLSNISVLELSVAWEQFGLIFNRQILLQYESLLISQKINSVELNEKSNIKLNLKSKLETNFDYLRLSLVVMGTLMPEFWNYNVLHFLEKNELMKKKYLELRFNIIKEIFILLINSNFTSYDLYRLKHKYLFENNDFKCILAYLKISIIFIINNIFDTLTFINYYNADFNSILDLRELREIQTKDIYSQNLLTQISTTLFPKDLLLMKKKSKVNSRTPQHFSIFLIINEYSLDILKKYQLNPLEWNQLSAHHGTSDFIINIINEFYLKINGLLKFINFSTNIFVELKIKAYTKLINDIHKNMFLQIINKTDLSLVKVNIKVSLEKQLNLYKEDIKKLIIIEKDIIKIIKKNKPDLKEYIPKSCHSETLDPDNFCETSEKVFANFLRCLPESFKDLDNIKKLSPTEIKSFPEFIKEDISKLSDELEPDKKTILLRLLSMN